MRKVFSILLAVVLVIGMVAVGCPAHTVGRVDPPAVVRPPPLPPDTGQVVPGEFTEFENGLLIAAHPYAVDAPISIRVEGLDVSDDAQLLSDAQITGFGHFVEVVALGMDEPVFAAGDTEFFLAIPVPEHLGDSNLVPLVYEYWAYAVYSDLEECAPCLDHYNLSMDMSLGEMWLSTDGGIFDPVSRLYVVPVYFIGTHEFPTRVGIIRDETYATEEISAEAFDLISEYFELEISLGAGTAAELSQTVIEPMSSNPGFLIRCYLQTVRCGASEVAPVKLAMEQTLPIAKARYEQMIGNPSPRLKTVKWHERDLCNDGHHKKYKYYWYDEKTRGSRCAPIGESGIVGMYNSGSKVAYTCLAAAGNLTNPLLGLVRRTTNHELYHSFQRDYDRGPSDLWVVEGTAALNEAIDLMITTNERPVDVGLLAVDEDELYEYQAEHFWFWLLERSGLQQKDLGHLFREGLTTAAARRFIERRTPFASLEDAHWHWVRCAAFDGIEGGLPTIWGPTYPRYNHRCTFNSRAFESPDHGSFTAPSEQQSPLVVPVDDVGPMAARMITILLPPRDYLHYYEVTINRNDPRVWIYPCAGHTTYVRDTWTCREDGHNPVSFAPLLSAASTPVDGKIGRIVSFPSTTPRWVDVLIANSASVASRTYRITVTGPYPQNPITDITLSPASPRALSVDDAVSFTFNYCTDEPTGVLIWGRPFTQGQPTPIHSAHASGIHPPGCGGASGWFRVSNPGTVDQIRLQMWADVPRVLLHEQFIDVDYTFVGANSITGITLSPQSPLNLHVGDTVSFTFNYCTDEPTGVLIWGRPFTQGQPTPIHSAHVSGIHPQGCSKGSGWFRVSNPGTVDQIRFQMWADVPRVLLLELFIDVNYIFWPPT